MCFNPLTNYGKPGVCFWHKVPFLLAVFPQDKVIARLDNIGESHLILLLMANNPPVLNNIAAKWSDKMLKIL